MEDEVPVAVDQEEDFAERAKSNRVEAQPVRETSTSIAPILEEHEEEDTATELEQVRGKLAEMIDPRKARKDREREIAMEDPNNVGMVIDHEFVVDPWKIDVDRRIEYAKKIGGVSDEEIEAHRENPESVAAVESDRESERAKVAALKEYLNEFEGKLEHVRVHAPGEVSPLTLGAAVRYEDGVRRIELPEEFVEQVRMIQEAADDVTLVVQFFNPDNGPDNASPIPEGQALEDYIALCEHALDTFGDGMALEFGVEPNVSRETGGEESPFKISMQYLPSNAEVGPEKYGAFYASVASAIKESHPDARCIPAGTAFFDADFTRGMIQAVQAHERSTGQEGLIDELSFHPYRSGEADKPCITTHDGQFGAVEHDSYESQLEAFKALSAEYGDDVPVRLGEFNFTWREPDWERKLRDSITISKEAGVPTYIYPGFKDWD